MLGQVYTLHFKDNAFASSKSLTRYASAPAQVSQVFESSDFSSL